MISLTSRSVIWVKPGNLLQKNAAGSRSWLVAITAIWHKEAQQSSLFKTVIQKVKGWMELQAQFVGWR
jgi:hypothetical protein